MTTFYTVVMVLLFLIFLQMYPLVRRKEDSVEGQHTSSEFVYDNINLAEPVAVLAPRLVEATFSLPVQIMRRVESSHSLPVQIRESS